MPDTEKSRLQVGMGEVDIRGYSPITHCFYQYTPPTFNTSPSGLGHRTNDSQEIVAIDSDGVNTVACASCSNSVPVVLF